jgi:prepilin-type N-terminal cleavage/methylation domain-containing protein
MERKGKVAFFERHRKNLQLATMKGFTLIELLVVIFIFSLAIGSISGIFISGISSQRRVLEEQEILNEISYALEYMGRAIRMAKKDDISFGGQIRNCLSQNKANYETPTPDQIVFRNYQNQCQRFYLSSDRRVKEEKKTDGGGSIISDLDLTSPNLKINSLKFRVLGERQEDYYQPRVTIFMEVERGGRKIQFQTTVSQRDLDVLY